MIQMTTQLKELEHAYKKKGNMETNVGGGNVIHSLEFGIYRVLF